MENAGLKKRVTVVENLLTTIIEDMEQTRLRKQEKKQSKQQEKEGRSLEGSLERSPSVVAAPPTTVPYDFFEPLTGTYSHPGTRSVCLYVCVCVCVLCVSACVRVSYCAFS